MKSLVVLTYYHLMHAIAMALTFDEKPNLYFSMHYLDPDGSLLERIRETEIFNKVVAITKKGENSAFTRELKKTRGLSDSEIDAMGTSLFDEYLVPKYAEYFKDADPEDEIYIYNDLQLHYYYMCRHFKNIVGVEDGYCSLPRQITAHRFKDDLEDLNRFISKGYYPEPLYRHEKVSRIISSVGVEDEYYSSKLQVWDFRDIVAQNEEKFRDALLYIFKINDIDIKEHSTLYLGQPLDRAQYCNARENYLLCKKIIRSETEKGYTVYYKPHPAERNHIKVYGGDNVVVLPNDFPVEALNYMDGRFDRLVTFDSTGVSTMTCAKESHRYLKLTGFTKEELIDYIKKDIKGEKIEIDVYLIARDCSPETYINIYSWIFRNADIHTNIHILTDRNDGQSSCRTYYDTGNLENMVSSFRKKYKGTQNEVRWHKELGWIKGWIDRYKPSVEIHAVSSFSERDIYREVIADQDHSHDYVLLAEAHDPAFLNTKAIAANMRRRIFPLMLFHQYTTVEDVSGETVKIPLVSGYLNNERADGIINKVWHREILKAAGEELLREPFTGIDTSDFAGHIRKSGQLYLYLPPAKYYSIKDGEQYYSERISALKSALADDREALVSGLIGTVYEYCDRNRVVNYGAGDVSEIEAIEDLIDDAQMKYEVYRRTATAIFHEKKEDDMRMLAQDSSYYQELRPMIDKAAESGLLNALENIDRIKNKIGIKRQGKK
ncbi:MAG: hypothetical protein IJH92_06040 [Mogibacterium sp.]|nr:hypothetical protein [Mogibacterium sp.]